MAVAAGRIHHTARLSTVDHLHELRGRLIVSLAAIAVGFGFCMWQNHALLHVINKPLETQTQKQVRAGNGPLGATYTAQHSTLALATQLQRVVNTLERPGSGASPADNPPRCESRTARYDHAPVGGAARREACDARDL